ncbi:MAG: amino acid ABC transporter permease [Lachnospiraceae bacterium]
MLNLFDLSVVKKDLMAMLEYLPVTLKLTAWSALIGLVLGFILAVIRIKKIPVLRQITGFLVSIVRGTPVIVQLYITYFGIPIAIKYINYYQGTQYSMTTIQPIMYAILALGINTAAYNAVTIQSALEAVNKGEIEAAASLGLSGTQRMFRIIVPEAVELALPSLGNTLIGLVKGTSLAFTCSVIEMTAAGKIMAGRDYRYFEAYVALAVIYWIITIVLELIMNYIINMVRVPETPEKRKGFFWFLKVKEA